MQLVPFGSDVLIVTISVVLGVGVGVSVDDGEVVSGDVGVGVSTEVGEDESGEDESGEVGDPSVVVVELGVTVPVLVDVVSSVEVIQIHIEH